MVVGGRTPLGRGGGGLCPLAGDAVVAAPLLEVVVGSSFVGVVVVVVVACLFSLLLERCGLCGFFPCWVVMAASSPLVRGRFLSSFGARPPVSWGIPLLVCWDGVVASLPPGVVGSVLSGLGAMR